MITLKKLIEKFEDKGVEFNYLLPYPPLFDPSCLELSYSSREELKERFDKVNNWRFEHYQKQLDDLETYIDRQNYK